MLRRSVSWLASAAILIGTSPTPLYAQPTLPAQENPAPVQGQGYSAQQLDSIVAPVALYPDVLLTQVLMASAFPLQIVEAYRWVQQGGNRQIQGDRLAQVLQGRAWDPSVKSLVPFPGVLAQLNGNLEWLQQIGFAVANQQEEVLDAVQRLRQQAAAAGNLRSNDQYVVRTEERIIYIEPPPTGVVYVPAYDPNLVFGSWAYPAYPPVYFAPQPLWGISPVVGAALVFGVGIVVVAGLWGIGHSHWRQRNIFIDHNRYNRINFNRPAWRGNDVWRPQHSQSFPRGGGQHYMQGHVNPPGFAGGPGRGPAFGGGRGGIGNPPGALGGPGRGPAWDGGRRTGNFGAGQVVPPGQQFRDRGGPGTVGNSGIVPPGHQGGVAGPGGGQNFRRQGNPGGGSQFGGSAGGGQNFRSQGNPGGGQNFRQQPNPAGAVHTGGSPGGGQSFRQQGGGGHQSGGGGGGGGNRGGDRDHRRNSNN